MADRHRVAHTSWSRTSHLKICFAMYIRGAKTADFGLGRQLHPRHRTLGCRKCSCSFLCQDPWFLHGVAQRMQPESSKSLRTACNDTPKFAVSSMMLSLWPPNAKPMLNTFRQGGGGSSAPSSGPPPGRSCRLSFSPRPRDDKPNAAEAATVRCRLRDSQEGLRRLATCRCIWHRPGHCT